MTELFSLQFFRNALLMSLILSVLFGALSFFVVMRRMSFLGAGVAHTAFGGVAIGVFFGVNPFLSALAFCAASALLIGRLTRFGRISYDTGIGIFFSFSMALGALLIAMRREFTFDLMGYLFGNILGVTAADILTGAICLALFIPFIALFLHRILFLAFDEEVAAVSGVRTEILDSALLVFLAAIIVVSIKIVGIILVSALVVLPASFGLLISTDFRKVLAWGCAYSVAIMTGGLFLSYVLDTPAGATIVTAGTLLYFTGLALVKIRSH